MAIYNPIRDDILGFLDSIELHHQDDELISYYQYCKSIRRPKTILDAAASIAKKIALKERRKEFNSKRNRQLLAMLADGVEYICAHPDCNKSEELQVDHIIPLSKGGGDELENLQFLCKKHNASKGNR